MASIDATVNKSNYDLGTGNVVVWDWLNEFKEGFSTKPITDELIKSDDSLRAFKNNPAVKRRLSSLVQARQREKGHGVYDGIAQYFEVKHYLFSYNIGFFDRECLRL